MTNKLIDFVIYALISALFIMAMLNFNYGISIDNGANNTVLDHPTFSALNGTISGDIDEAVRESGVQVNNTENSQISIGDSLIVDANFGTWRSFKNLIVGIFSGFVSFSEDVLGIPAIALTLTLAIVSVLLLFLGIKWLRTGE